MATLEELLNQRAALDEQIEATRNKERSSAIAQVSKLIAEHKLSAQECGFGGKAGKASAKATKSVAPKYRSASGQSWTGRGKPPRWLVDYEAGGGNRENLKI